MPLSPGKIQDLPIKILYTLDTSSQSYVTVLPERQPVYVHSIGPAHAPNEGGLGSCYLKAAARGICFASPECIPNTTTLDFSVYTLDPSLRTRATRAFPSTANTAASPQPPLDDSWTGKGFLSWILSELGTGKTLLRGRLMRDHDFSSSAFNEQGGLEGLMAAASRFGANSQRDDLDGRGWGLEVCLSLKMVNPEGKDEFKGRREFEEMLRRGTGLASVSSPVRSVATSTPRGPQHTTTEPIRRNPPSAQPPRISAAAAPNQIPNLHHSSSNPSSGRPSSAASHQPSPHIPPRPASSASTRISQPSSLPPSSIPMQPSSSAGAGPSQPRQSSSMSAPPARTNGHASSSTHNGASRDQSREVTPPPLPQRKSPPPSTPSREKLAALLRTDEKMSPSMAKQLAQNPVLLRLLKAVPPGTLAFTQPVESKASPDSGDAPTPTPSGPPPPVARPGPAEGIEGCCNCGTKETDVWRTKNMKDGTKKKVCNACGLYFNKHKRMRPPELWGTNAHDDHPSQDKRPKIEDHHPPVRSSPRLNRIASDHAHPPPVPAAAESPRKRRSTKPVPQPSPRMATRSSTRHDAGPSVTLGMEGKQLDFSESLFSPSTMFGTSPAQPMPNPALGVDSTAQGTVLGDGELDIEAILAQLVAAEGQNGFSLDALFASTDTSGVGGTGGGGGGSLMDLLSAWDEGTKEGVAPGNESGPGASSANGTSGASGTSGTNGAGPA